jgi:phosphatidylglycerophosphate synthase
LLVTVLVVVRAVRRRSMPSRQTLRWISAGLMLALLLILAGMALPIFMLGTVAASLQ